MTTIRILVSAAIAAACLPALAGEVYRCTTDGKTAYQSTPCADGKRLDLPSNAVQAIDQRDAMAKSAAIDAENRKRMERAAEINARSAAANFAQAERCKNIHDNIARQRAWMAAQSDAVRASAAAEISIQRRNLEFYGCQ